ncbi:acylphosphatase [uncultured Cetobacterium sp.]|uniref:acylphosphatase n=1 Tax=uncultured Cetobacterium sp. TaxID=527638 RepID=UPI002621017A|nr:acylphosphatase [uncultured Cetobacterium sp.]
MQNNILTYHFIIKGRVQGVGYRLTAYLNATKLNLVGSIKNLNNGDVEIFVQGDKNFIEDFKEYLKIGSSLSKVLSIDETTLKLPSYNSFKILY